MEAIKLNGKDTKMQTLASRANELAQVSSTKSKNDYRDSLTAGDLRL